MYDTFEGLDALAQFQSLNEYCYLEIVQAQNDDTKSTWDEGTLSDDGVRGWLKSTVGFLILQSSDILLISKQPDNIQTGQTSNVRASLRMLLCAPRGESESHCVVLPFPRSLYAEIAKSFQLPSAFLGHATAEGKMVSQFEAFEGGWGVLVMMKRRKLVATYDPSTETLYVLMMGHCQHERERFVNELRHYKETTPLIAAVLASWVSVVSQIRAWAFVDKKMALLRIESELGMLWNGENDSPKDLLRLNFETLIMKLVNLNGAWNGTAIDLQLDLITRLLDKDQHSFERLMAGQELSETLRRRLVETKDLLSGLLVTNTEIQHRANIQLQIVSTLKHNQIGYW